METMTIQYGRQSAHLNGVYFANGFGDPKCFYKGFAGYSAISNNKGRSLMPIFLIIHNATFVLQKFGIDNF